jgi:hypothetical protein
MPSPSGKDIIERLAKAGVLNPSALSPSEVDAIGELTEAEVRALISVREKVGDQSKAVHGHCAWIL